MPPEAKVIFVVRIRGLNKIAPKVRLQAAARQLALAQLWRQLALGMFNEL